MLLTGVWVVVALLLPFPTVLSSALFFAWCATAVWALGTWVRPADGVERMAGGLILFLPLFGVPLALASVWSSLNTSALALTVAGVSLCAAWLSDGRWFWQRLSVSAWRFDWTLLAAIGAIAGDILLCLHQLLLRTDLPLSSPWELASPAIFVVYGATTWLVFLTARERKGSLPVFVSILHFAATYAVSLIVFKIGFGFDPFIHRAAETALANDGFIEPRRFLYSGQYALVAALHRFTHLSIFHIDQFLVPGLTALSLPLVARLGLTKGWKLSVPEAQLWLHVLLLFPVMAFTFTVPHNLALLFFVWTLFLISYRPVLLLPLACFAILTHPLVGVPLALLIGTAVLLPRLPRWLQRLTLAFFFLGTALLVPALLWLGPRGAAAPDVQLGRLRFYNQFVDLFRDPYLFTGGGLEVLYLLRLVVPVIILGLSLLGLRRLAPPFMRSLLAVFVAGLGAALYALSTLFLFPDIIDYEQREFAFRLLQATLLVSLPLLAVWLSRWAHRHAGTFFRQALLFTVLSAWATGSWYLSYPQENAKVTSAGPSVGRDDIALVHLLEARNQGTAYVVLANQMTSAAALHELGFLRYTKTDPPALWYPLPTGGSLYAHYVRMNAQPSRAEAQVVAEETKVTRVYFVTYGYWPQVVDIRRQAALDADHIIVVRAPDMIVFEYLFQ